MKFLRLAKLYMHISIFFVLSGSTVLIGSPNLSIKQEIERSLDKGLKWLHGEQNSSSGYWGSPQYPALSALVLRATLGHPNDEEVKAYRDQVSKGFKFLRSKVQTDGGIYGKGLASYNTSISLMAFLQLNDSQDEEVIRGARKFLVNQQSDFDQKGKTDHLFDGGVGYGSTWAHSDLSNTHLAMEAFITQRNLCQEKREISPTSIGRLRSILFLNVRISRRLILKVG